MRTLFAIFLILFISLSAQAEVEVLTSGVVDQNVSGTITLDHDIVISSSTGKKPFKGLLIQSDNFTCTLSPADANMKLVANAGVLYGLRSDGGRLSPFRENYTVHYSLIHESSADDKRYLEMICDYKTDPMKSDIRPVQKVGPKSYHIVLKAELKEIYDAFAKQGIHLIFSSQSSS